MLLVAAGIYAFYFFEQWLQVARVGLLLAIMGLAITVAATSAPGKTGIKFSSKALSEGKKVVWPARPEATQITLIVIAGAIIASLFVWLADTVLFKVIYGLVLGV